MDNSSLISFLKEKRKEKKLTFTALSKLSGVSQPYLSQLESGKRQPSPEILKKLSEPLDVPLYKLMVLAGYSDKRTLIDEIILDLNKAALKIKDTRDSMADYKGRAEWAKKNNNTKKGYTAKEYLREYDELTKVLENDMKRYNEINGRLYELKKDTGYYTDEDIWQLKAREDFFNSMTPDEFKEFEEDEFRAYKKHWNIKQYQEKMHTRIEDFLNDERRSFYIDDHKLTLEEIRMLITLYGGKEKDYPSDEQIEKEYEEIKKVREENKRKVNDGEAFFIVDPNYDIDTNENA